MNIKNKVSDAERANALANRESELNPPEYSPGMADSGGADMDDEWGGFGDVSGGVDSSANLWGDASGGMVGGSDPWGSVGGGDGMSTSNPWDTPAVGGANPWDTPAIGANPWDNVGGFGVGNPQPQDQGKATEDEIFDTIAIGAKGAFAVLKAAVAAKKTLTVEKRMGMGKQLIVMSGISTVLGLIMWICSLSIGFSLFFGGLLSLGTGVLLFMTSYGQLQKHPELRSPAQPQVPAVEQSPFETPTDSPIESDPFGTDDFGGDISFDDDDEIDLFDDEDDDFFSSSPDIDDDMGLAVDVPVSTQLTKDEILSTMTVDNGLVTRQYLFEHVAAVLSMKTPDYNYVKVIDTSAEDFANWAAIIEECAGVLRGNDNKGKLPQLLELKEKLFYYSLTITREKWCKTDALVNEIVNYVGFDEETGKMEEGIYGNGHDAASKTYITIMKGETAMVTVRDVFNSKSEFFLDTNNQMPVVLGIDKDGEAVVTDLMDINAMLVTGMPRSGKSWTVKSLLWQMMAFTPPEDLQFYFLDPKGSISDFRTIKTPHVRKFVDSDDGIVSELRYIVKNFAPKRKELIGNAGCVNIQDYWRSHPNDSMPLIYVVIDEVVTLAERMEKDVKAEFQGLLTELVSQLPALGIRIFMIPHVVKDQIIKKTTTDLIPCRISVRGDSAHIESSLGVKNFGYRLFHVGDMAVRLNNDQTKFVHSCILSDTNSGTDEAFNFLDAMWRKIDPSCNDLPDINGQSVPVIDVNSLQIESTPREQVTPARASTRKAASKPAKPIPVINNTKSAEDDINIWGD